jgi:glycosyltransferase involved in cell wall biosynthesis
MTKYSARRAHRVVTVSNVSATEIQRWLGIDARRILLAPPAASHIDVRAPRATASPTVLFVGSLFNRRRVPEMLQGFALARRRLPGARFVLAGDNRTTPRLDPRGIADQLGIRDAVDYLEYVSDSDLAGLYADAGVLLFISDYEGFGIPPMEALAHGVPVILADTPLSRELLGDGARLVDPRPDAIADAIVALLTDSGERLARVGAGQARLRQFTWVNSATTIRHALADAARR